MANTTTIQGVNLLRGESGTKGELRFYEVALDISGTYATGSKPNFNMLTALQSQRQAPQTITVRWARLARDIVDSSGNRYTAPNANITLSDVNTGCTGDKITCRLDTASGVNKNGAAPGEVGDGTTTAGTLVLIVAVEILT